jgi:hypothetical protein
MAKTAQVLSSLNENFFDFFDFAVKKFCGSSLGCAGSGFPLQFLVLPAAVLRDFHKQIHKVDLRPIPCAASHPSSRM